MNILIALLILAVAALSVITTYKLNQRIDNLHSQIEASCHVASSMKDSAAKMAAENAELKRLVDRYSATVDEYTVEMDIYKNRFKNYDKELEKIKLCEYDTIINYYAEQEGRV